MSKASTTYLCAKCGELKDLSEFNKCKTKPRGHDYTCRDCRKIYSYKYTRTEAYLNSQRKYTKTEKYKAKSIKAQQTYKKKHPEKVKAHKRLNYLIERQKIEPKPCSMCGSEENIHKHHEDYSKPYEFIYVCHLCHLKIHGKERNYDKR